MRLGGTTLRNAFCDDGVVGRTGVGLLTVLGIQLAYTAALRDARLCPHFLKYLNSNLISLPQYIRPHRLGFSATARGILHTDWTGIVHRPNGLAPYTKTTSLHVFSTSLPVQSTRFRCRRRITTEAAIILGHPEALAGKHPEPRWPASTNCRSHCRHIEAPVWTAPDDQGEQAKRRTLTYKKMKASLW